LLLKADAYGHGAIEVAEVALRSGANRLAVATIEEGLQLRLSGRIPDSTPIHCMGLFMDHHAATFVKYNITPTVHSVGAVRAIENAAHSIGRRFPIHLKIDTGMGRIGALPKSVESIAKAIEESKTLLLEGVFTHFSKADEKDKSYTKKQVESFEKCLSTIKRHHLKPLYVKNVESGVKSLFSSPVPFRKQVCTCRE
jgi:alanine racemase